MKHIIYILTLFTLLTLPAAAQKKKQETPTIDAQTYIDKYMFEKAEEVLEKEIKNLKRRRKPTQSQETKLEEIDRLRSIMSATERVTFIDSLVVSKKDFFKHIALGDECGRIIPARTFFDNQNDTTGAMIYKPEIGERIWLAIGDESGNLKLHYSDCEDSEWNIHKQISELDSDSIQNYPYVMADGITLYYAAQGEESIGGYDIFVTRYDSDENKYLQPENLGMPFNSPANDYMFAIDEFNALGWFVSDRNQPEGKVCIYVFIPNNVRKQYDTRLYTEEEMGRLALIHSIAETWGDRTYVNEAKERLKTVRSSWNSDKKTTMFQFIINDHLTYYNPTDFKSDTAKKLINEWIHANKQNSSLTRSLDVLRETYGKSDAKQKAKMAPHIMKDETELEKNEAYLNDLTKRIRNAEIEALNK